MATATVDLSEFNVQADEFGTSEKSYRYQFWKKPDGTVTVAGSWPVEYARLVRRGFTPLDRFGTFLVNPNNYQTVMVEKLRDDPAFALEFPVAQLLEYGWHRKAPAGVVFPQLDGIDHQDVHCTVCNRPFLSTEDLSRHESIAHKEASANNSLARALATALGKGDGSGVVEAITLLAESQQQQGQILAALAQSTQQMQAILADLAGPTKPSK